MNTKFANSIIAGLTLAGRNVRLQIQEHLLGYSWNIIIPVLYAICFIFVKQAILGRDQSDPEHWWSVLRAFSGITLFQFWFQLLRDISEFIRSNRGVLRGLNIGISPFILSLIFEGMFLLCIRFITILVAIPLVGISYPDNLISWLYIVLALLSMIVSAVAIGLLLAPWSVLYGDVRRALQSMALPIILISPIFYPAVTQSELVMYWVNMFNPIASPLAVINASFQGTPQIYLTAVVAWICVSIVIVAWSSFNIRKQIPILLERMGS